MERNFHQIQTSSESEKMLYQTAENELENLSEILTYDDSGKMKKRKHKYRAGDASDKQVNGEVVHQLEEFQKGKKKRKKHKFVREDHDISCDGGLVPESQNEPETEASNNRKKKHRHQHDSEEEYTILLENIPTTSVGSIKTENESTGGSLDTEAIQDVNFIMPNPNVNVSESETSRKRNKKAKHRQNKEDEIGPKAVSCDDGLPESDEDEKMKRDQCTDAILYSIAFDMNWILAPSAPTDCVTSNEVQHSYTLQATRENENDRIISFLEPSENIRSVLNVPFQEVVVNVLSSTDLPVDPSELLNVPSTPNVPLQDTLINVPSANDPPLQPPTNSQSTANVSPTQNDFASISVPSICESPVDLFQTASGNVSLMHNNAVVNFSKESSSDSNCVDDSATDLSRKSLENVSVMYNVDILQSHEHLENDLSIRNLVTATSYAEPSSNFQSARKRLFTEEISNELSTGSKTPLSKRKVLFVKVRAMEATKGSKKSVSEKKVRSAKARAMDVLPTEVNQKSLPAGNKNSLRGVSRKPVPIEGVHCVKTCTTQADHSENFQPNERPVKGECTQHKSSSVEKQSKRVKHPDLPKQPVSVYVRFMRDCRKEILRQNPKLKPAQVFVEAGNRYRQLKDEDKAKYMNEFLLETKEYNVAVKTFLENHPEHRNHWAAKKRNNLEKWKAGSVEIISGQQLYINKRTQEHFRTQPADKNIRFIKANYRKEWRQSLSAQVKAVYVLEAQKLNAMNAAFAQSPEAENSDPAKRITASNIHEVEEQFCQANLVAPPMNGYQLFIKENADAELPFGEINRLWKKQLSQEERNTYTARAKLARVAYKKNLAEFEKKEKDEAEFQKLPLAGKLRNVLKDEHKFLTTLRRKEMKKAKKHPDASTGRPPINGYRLFFKERMPTVKDLDFKLRFAELNAQWKNQLSQEEREEYTARAKSAYEKFMEEHPGLYRNEVDDKSEALNNMTHCNSFGKTRKKRLQHKDGSK